MLLAPHTGLEPSNRGRMVQMRHGSLIVEVSRFLWIKEVDYGIQAKENRTKADLG